MPKPGPRTTYRYSESFKATAERLNSPPGVAVGDVAESLYPRPYMLSRWRRLEREGQIVAKGVDVDLAASPWSAACARFHNPRMRRRVTRRDREFQALIKLSFETG